MKNIGLVDKFLRVGAGALLLSMVFIGPQTALGWLGLIPLVTGVISFCPIYRLFGMNSCRKCERT